MTHRTLGKIGAFTIVLGWAAGAHAECAAQGSEPGYCVSAMPAAVFEANPVYGSSCINLAGGSMKCVVGASTDVEIISAPAAPLAMKFPALPQVKVSAEPVMAELTPSPVTFTYLRHDCRDDGAGTSICQVNEITETQKIDARTAASRSERCRTTDNGSGAKCEGAWIMAMTNTCSLN
ncbi:MAG: hypothetical protein AB7H77_08690, partial [Bdellovibrionales bacterium]